MQMFVLERAVLCFKCICCRPWVQQLWSLAGHTAFDANITTCLFLSLILFSSFNVLIVDGFIAQKQLSGNCWKVFQAGWWRTGGLLQLFSCCFHEVFCMSHKIFILFCILEDLISDAMLVYMAFKTMLKRYPCSSQYQVQCARSVSF